MDDDRYTIDQLCALTDYSKRTVRYYVQEGLLEPPAGRGRGGFYFDSHLQRLREIRSMQDQGMKLEAIGRALALGEAPRLQPLAESFIRYQLAPGVELQVKQDVLETENRKIRDLVRVARAVLEGGKENG